MATGSRAEKVAEWQERFARFDRSGTSIAQFCRDGSFAPVRVVGDVNFGGQLTLTAELRGGTRLTIPLAGPETLQLAIAALVEADAERAGDRPC